MTICPFPKKKKRRSVHLLTKGNYSNLCVKWSNCAIIFCDSFFIDFKDNHDVIVKVCYLYVA